MKIDTSLKIRVHPGVYPPSEDSYFLIKCLKVGKEKALDMGTGTGIIAFHMAQQGARVTAVDKSPLAVANTQENMEINNLNIQVIQSDLFTNVPGRFDVITFNPPYLPPGFPQDESWDGGTEGIEISWRFLSDASKHLTKNGRIYLLLSTLGAIQKLLNDFKQYYCFQELRTLSFFFEKIRVYEITH